MRMQKLLALAAFWAAFFIIAATSQVEARGRRLISIDATPSVHQLREWGRQVGIPWRFGNRAWCGLWTCKEIGVCPGYRADAWRRYARTNPFPGAIAVRRNGRHVGIVQSVTGNMFVMRQGNFARRVATTYERVSSYTFHDPRRDRRGWRHVAAR